MNLRVCVCLLTMVLLASCSAEYYMKRGNAVYETGRFHKASGKYVKAYSKAKAGELQAEAALRAGRCFQDVNKLKESYDWYRRAEKAGKELPVPMLKVAELTAARGDLDSAIAYYGRYEKKYGDGKGSDAVNALELVRKEMENGGRYEIAPKKEFNSSASDFAPVYYPGDTCIVYLASTRNAETKRRRQKTDPITGYGYSHIFVTDFVQEIKTKDKLGNVKVRKFREPRWQKPAAAKDSLFSSRHEGALCFSEDGNTLYFTSSRIIEGYNRGTRIYKATRGTAADGEERKGWNGLAKSGICGDTVSVGHPALTADGNRMYFVSDRLPGGFGGKDIWYVEKAGEKWGEPVNAGELINTPGNEMFPYVRDNGEFYFSSDGHGGFGGLDLYKVVETEGKQQLAHLPAPLNSFADDFGIAFKPGLDEGLLTSSRSGRSDDIFSFRYIRQKLGAQMLARNSVTEQPVVGVNVVVTADDGSVVYLLTDSSGRAAMEVMPDREYVFVTDDPRFLKGKGTVSTYREKADRFYELTVDIQPIEKPIVIPNIYFDQGKWELRPDAKENLKELLTIMKDNPNIVIELSAHTDMIGNDQANMTLSENRARSVVDYLIEKKINWDRMESKGYGETQPRQINEKDAKTYPFLKNGDVLTERFVKALKGEEREMAMQLNRRIEFKVIRTNYKPGPNSHQRPGEQAQPVVAEKETSGATKIKELSSVKGAFYTLQLGVFRSVPELIKQFKVVFTETTKQGTRYCTGIYDTREEAQKAMKELKAKGITTIVLQRK